MINTNLPERPCFIGARDFINLDKHLTRELLQWKWNASAGLQAQGKPIAAPVGRL
jgi:hypothetical protein